MRLIEQLPQTQQNDEEGCFSRVEIEIENENSIDPRDFPTHELSYVRWYLGTVRRKPVPPSTLRVWKSCLGIEPDPSTGLYSQDDLDRLAFLVRRLRSGKFSIQQIAVQIYKGMYRAS